MLTRRTSLTAAGIAALLAFAPIAQARTQAQVQAPTPAWTVKHSWVSAHENFLASSALRGRGSATADETVAATYVASMFELYGLAPAPGMTGYLQTAPVLKTTPSGHARLSLADITAEQGAGLSVLTTSNLPATGTITVAGDDPATLGAAEIVLAAPAEGASPGAWINAAAGKGARMIVLRETDALKALTARRTPRPSWRLDETRAETSATPAPASAPAASPAPALARPPFDAVIVSADIYDRLKMKAGQTLSLDPGQVLRERTFTTNAVGYLAGSDPDAGYILISAHLDHLGVVNGVVMPGANDDASGTAAVMELAHALAAGPQPRRGILFAAYGSEEIGGLGSTFFAEHPPVPLDQIAANLAIEMIGGQDPNLPPGVMMMTGFERSNFGPALQERGALITADPYPEQNFFRRSDNYSLALKGIVAHTISGYATTPTYHSAQDDIAHLDLAFMARAIQSLIEPIRWLATSDFKPDWVEGGRPTR